VLPAVLAAAKAQPANVAGEIAMGIALTLQEYLDDHHVPYDVMLHKRTHCAFDTARATHLPGERIAKGVVLTREGGFVIAVVPATARVRLDVIERALHCRVDLATGFVIMTSRCSFELVQKSATYGIGALVTVSAPTALALDIARKARLFVASLDGDGVVVLNS
jgi:hypothetical protein